MLCNLTSLLPLFAMGLLDGVGDVSEAETDDDNGDATLSVNGHSMPSLNGHVVGNDNEPNLTIDR